MISIVIPNYNGNKYLKNCLDSIIFNTSYNTEIIIIDNASTDSSYNWLKEYPSVLFKRLDKNYGFSKAVNEGIKLSKGEYVLLLNNDTELCKGFIDELIRVIKQDNQIFAVSSKMIQYHHKDLIDDAGDEYSILGWTFKRGDNESIQKYTEQTRVFSACAGAALYNKALFAEVGYFDENFFAYMEDLDICYRANIGGYKNVYAPEAKVYHIGSATSGSKYNTFKVKLAARNNIYVLYKNMPLLQFLINMPFILIGYLIKTLFFIKKGFGKQYILGIFEGITTLGKVQKVKFKMRNISNYLYIEWLLIKNVFKFIGSKLKGK